MSDQRRARKALDILDEKLEAGVIADDRYKARAEAHVAVIARTTQLLTTADTDAERWLELARETFASVVNLSEVFVVANDDERRRLMMLVGSNWYLSNKKVALTVREPLKALRHNNENPIWRARPDSNRRSSP